MGRYTPIWILCMVSVQVLCIDPSVDVSHVLDRDVVKIPSGRLNGIKSDDSTLYLTVSDQWKRYITPDSRRRWPVCDYYYGLSRQSKAFIDSNILTADQGMYSAALYHYSWNYNLVKMSVRGKDHREASISSAVEMPTRTVYKCADTIVFPFIDVSNNKINERVYCIDSSNKLLMFDGMSDKTDSTPVGSILKTPSNNNRQLFNIRNFSSPLTQRSLEDPSEKTISYTYFMFNFSNATLDDLKLNIDNSYILFVDQSLQSAPRESILDLSKGLKDILGVEGFTNIYEFIVQPHTWKVNKYMRVVQIYGWVESTQHAEGYQCMIDINELKLSFCNCILKEKSYLEVRDISTIHTYGPYKTRLTYVDRDSSVKTNEYVFDVSDADKNVMIYNMNSRGQISHELYSIDELKNASVVNFGDNINLVRKMYTYTTEEKIGSNKTINKTRSYGIQFVDVYDYKDNKRYFIYGSEITNIYRSITGNLVSFDLSGCINYYTREDYSLIVDTTHKEYKITDVEDLAYIDYTRGKEERYKLSLKFTDRLINNVSIDSTRTSDIYNEYPTVLNLNRYDIHGPLHTVGRDRPQNQSEITDSIMSTTLQSIEWWTNITEGEVSKRVRLDTHYNNSKHPYVLGTHDLFFSIPQKSLFKCVPVEMSSRGNVTTECSIHKRYDNFGLSDEVDNLQSYYLTGQRLTILYTQNVSDDMNHQSLLFTSIDLIDGTIMHESVEDRIVRQYQTIRSSIVQTHNEIYITYMIKDASSVSYLYYPYDGMKEGQIKGVLGKEFTQMWSVVPSILDPVEGTTEVIITTFGFRAMTRGYMRKGVYTDYSSEFEHVHDAHKHTLGMCILNLNVILHDGMDVISVDRSKNVRTVVHRGHSNSNRVITSIICVSDSIAIVTEFNLIDKLYGLFIIRDNIDISSSRYEGFTYINSTAVDHWLPHFYSNGYLYLSTGNRSSHTVYIDTTNEYPYYTKPYNHTIHIDAYNTYDISTLLSINISHTYINRYVPVYHNISYAIRSTHNDNSKTISVELGETGAHFWRFSLGNKTLEKDIEVAVQRFEFVGDDNKEGDAVRRRYWATRSRFRAYHENDGILIEKAKNDGFEFVARESLGQNKGIQEVIDVLEVLKMQEGKEVARYYSLVKRSLGELSAIEVHSGFSGIKNSPIEVQNIALLGQNDPFSFVWQEENSFVVYASLKDRRSLYLEGALCKEDMIKIDNDVTAFDFVNLPESKAALIIYITSKATSFKGKHVDLQTCAVSDVKISETKDLSSDAATRVLRCSFTKKDSLYCIHQTNKLIYLSMFKIKDQGKEVESASREEYIPYKNMIASQIEFDQPDVEKGQERKVKGFLVKAERLEMARGNFSEFGSHFDVNGVFYYKLWANRGTGFASGGIAHETLIRLGVFSDARISISASGSSLDFSNTKKKVQFVINEPKVVINKVNSEDVKNGIYFELEGETKNQAVANFVRQEKSDKADPNKKIPWILYSFILVASSGFMLSLIVLVAKCRNNKKKPGIRTSLKESLIENTITGASNYEENKQ